MLRQGEQQIPALITSHWREALRLKSSAAHHGSISSLRNKLCGIDFVPQQQLLSTQKLCFLLSVLKDAHPGAAGAGELRETAAPLVCCDRADGEAVLRELNCRLQHLQ